MILGLGEYLNVHCHVCIGGTNIHEDVSKLNSGQQVVSGTPGRVLGKHVRVTFSKVLVIKLAKFSLDMIKRRALPTAHIKMLVLDEADNMLKTGFQEQLYNIYRFLPHDTQVKQCRFLVFLPELYDCSNNIENNYLLGVFCVDKLN